ncbi:MAG TPA: O-antigen ligase family protein [Chlamydiales bacterium]|nr:O-antigen ligase family protein [Chlamydiales bacterium]
MPVLALRNLILSGIFLLPLVGFVNSFSLYYPYVTAKAFFLRILIECMTPAAALLWWADPNSRLKKSPILYSYMGFMGILLIADLFGVDLHQSFWGTFMRMEGFLTHLHFFALFLIASMVMDSEKLWIRFFLFSIACSFVMASYALLQKVGLIHIYNAAPRLDALTGHPCFLAIYMVTHIFLTAFVLSRIKNRYAKGYLILALILQFTTLYFTSTRGSQLGFFIALVVIGILYLRSHMKIVLMASCALLICSNLILVLKDTPFIQNHLPLNRIAHPLDRTAHARFQLWNVALKGFLDHPFLGWGQENFDRVFTQHYDPGMIDSEIWFDRSHNAYLDLLVYAGLSGLIAYLILCFLFGRACWKSSLSTFEKNCFLGLWIANLVHQFFLFQDLTNYFYFFIFLAFAHFLHKKPEATPLPLTSPTIKGAYPFLLISSPALCCCVWFWTIRPMLSCQIVQRAFEMPDSYSPEKTLQSYQSELSKRIFGFREIRYELMLTTLRIFESNQVDPEVKKNFLVFASSQAHAALLGNDLDLKLALFAAILFKNTQNPQFALPFFQKALEMCPNKQQVHCELACTHIALNNWEEAVSAAKEAYILTPRNLYCAITYITSLIYKRDLPLAESIMLDFFGTAEPENEAIGMAYIETQYLQKARPIYEKLLQNAPNSVHYICLLAQIEDACGKYEKAISYMQEAVQLNPQIENEAAVFMENVKKKLKEY